MLATLPRALAYAMSLLHDRALAEDVVHDCYTRLLAAADRYDLARDGTRLLYKSITHACVDRNYRDRRLLSLELELANGPADAPALADPRGGDPCEPAAYRELEAVENPVHVHDWHATVLRLLGLDHEKLTYRYAGREMRLTDVKGKVVRSIIA